MTTNNCMATGRLVVVELRHAGRTSRTCEEHRNSTGPLMRRALAGGALPLLLRYER